MRSKAKKRKFPVLLTHFFFFFLNYKTTNSFHGKKAFINQYF